MTTAGTLLQPQRELLRDAVLVAIVAIVTFQLLRRHVGDYYHVPSGSMEPTLHGDEVHGDIVDVHGDIVFVDWLADRAACRRHDMVVVKDPTKPGQQLVKRIAARGDDPECWIDMRDGDLWLGTDRQRMRREQKDPLEARAVRAPWAAWPPVAPPEAKLLDVRAARVEADQLVVPPVDAAAAGLRGLFTPPARRVRRQEPGRHVLPAGFVGTAQAVDASHTLPSGARTREGDHAPVVDCGMDLQVVEPAAELLASIDARDETLTFVWQPASGRLALWRNGEDVAQATLPVCPGAHRIEFGRLDDRAFFVVDGRRDAMFCFERRAEWQSQENTAMQPVAPRCHLHLGVAGERPLRLASLVVFRDLFAWRDRIVGQSGDWPRFVSPGHWFLLGDNSFDSRDSRDFGEVPTHTFLGRPWFVLGPWPRQRWLRP